MQIKDRIKELVRVKGSELIKNDQNWRIHPQEQREALSGVLSQIGIADALIARRTRKGLELIDGHMRVEENPDIKWPVLVLNVTAKEADELLATLDPLTAMANADAEKLASLLSGVSFTDDGTSEMLATLAEDNGIDLNESANGELDDPPAEIDKAEQLRKKWKVKKGQLWEIAGPSGLTHRLLCGDATQEDNVRLLMGVERAGLMNTDPPYGIGYDNASVHPDHGPIADKVSGDDKTGGAIQPFLESCWKVAVSHAIKKNAAWYMWHAMLTQGYFSAAAAAAAGVILHRQIIWVKPALVFGRGQYHWKHELCFMGWVEGNQPPDYGEGNGERTQTTVWEIDSVSNAERKEMNHSTPKPVELFRIPIVKHLKPGEIAYEPFAGSGPQFLAAEQLGRRCYGIEIEPKYVAVALERMKAIGCQATLAK